MPRYIRNHTAIAICDRCRFKVPYRRLRKDSNSPGLRVCPKCWDELDPYRLPARKTEKFNLRHPRPDTRLGPTPVGLSDTDQDFLLTDEDGNVIEIGEVE